MLKYRTTTITGKRIPVRTDRRHLDAALGRMLEMSR